MLSCCIVLQRLLTRVWLGVLGMRWRGAVYGRLFQFFFLLSFEGGSLMLFVGSAGCISVQIWGVCVWLCIWRNPAWVCRTEAPRMGLSRVILLLRALTLSRARIYARMRMHMYTTHTSARAQTRMHHGTRGPDHARTHAPAHEHACMRTHTRKQTRTCLHAHTSALRTCTQAHAYMRPHNVHTHAAHACTRPHNVHACIRTRTREHTCTCARTRVNTCPHILLRANRWGHTPQLWVTLSLFGC